MRASAWGVRISAYSGPFGALRFTPDPAAISVAGMVLFSSVVNHVSCPDYSFARKYLTMQFFQYTVLV